MCIIHEPVKGVPKAKYESESRKHERMKTRKEGQKAGSEDKAFDYQAGGVDVQQEARVQTGGFQIGPQLGKVNILKGMDCFQFQDDLLLDDEIQSLNSQVHSLEMDVDLQLPSERDASVLEGHFHGLLIDRLQEARAERLVNLHRRSEDSTRQFLECMPHNDPFFLFFVPSFFRVFVITS